MKVTWRTAWQGQEIVVWREDDQVDRFDATQVRRVVFMHRNGGSTPGDLVGALVRLESDWLLLPPETGFAGRVNFERQAFWAERACVYWVAEAQAPLPLRLRRGHWILRSASPSFARVPAAELDPVVDGWPLEGPQTWEQRKWDLIAASRPFAPAPEREGRLRA